jgi:hypothetical protein
MLPLGLHPSWAQSLSARRPTRSPRLVVCVTRWTSRGKSSDAVVDIFQVDVYELREGKVVRVTLAYPDKATALQSLSPGLALLVLL